MEKFGKERPITCISGDSLWPYDREPHVFQFESRGRDQSANAKVVKEGTGYRITIALRN